MIDVHTLLLSMGSCVGGTRLLAAAVLVPRDTLLLLLQVAVLIRCRMENGTHQVDLVRVVASADFDMMTGRRKRLQCALSPSLLLLLLC